MKNKRGSIVAIINQSGVAAYLASKWQRQRNGVSSQTESLAKIMQWRNLSIVWRHLIMASVKHRKRKRNGV